MQQRQGQDDHSDSMNQAMEVMLALSEYKMAIKAIKDTRDKLQEKLKPGSSTESHRAVRELLPHLEELSATIEEQIQALKGLGHDQGGDSPAPADTGWLGELEPLLHRSQNKLEKQTGENKLFQLQINQYLSSGQLQKVNFFKPVVIQLLQNSLAHGIEPVAERRQTGKAEQGIIRLTLQRRNQSTVLTVQDDGRGVPPELIVRKLQEKGQPVPQGPIDPQEAVKWILQSGFSAATHNTEIAGHGLGMDMVRRLVKEKNGKLSVRNRPHEGLAISITLPDAEN
jgi:signal transduction histidine kinase